MPKITISEEDLTLTNDLDVTANIVYVPGIALQGPVNKPILCESLADFIKVFGDKPYKFVIDQTFNGEVVANANDYERSFVYACELLQAGLHVLFERVVDQNQLANITGTWSDVSIGTGEGQVEFVPNKYYLKTETESGSGVYTYTLAEIYKEGSIYSTKAITEDSALISDIYVAFNPESPNLSVFNKLIDRWTYNFKFLTAGGYDTLSLQGTTSTRRPLTEMMAMVCALRGDSVALIDHKLAITSIEAVYNDINSIVGKDNAEADTVIENFYTLSTAISSLDSLSFTVSESRKKEITLKYAAIMTPWASYQLYASNIISLEDNKKMPGSFGYLLSLANSISTYDNPDYFAVAGVVRGLVPHVLGLCTEVTGAESEAVQVRTKGYVSINPIVDVQGYGECIWGNRTLFVNTNSAAHKEGDLSASSFLNVRVMVADVKKLIYAACQKYTFETNSTELWLRFKSEIEPELEKMVANGALESFELRKLPTTAKATLAVYVKLVTIYAVEDFDITIGLTDSTVEEAE